MACISLTLFVNTYIYIYLFKINQYVCARACVSVYGQFKRQYFPFLRYYTVIRLSRLLSLIRVSRNIGFRKESAAYLVAPNDLAHPPVWILLVEDGNDVSAFQLQFFRVSGLEVVVGDHFWLQMKTLALFNVSMSTRKIAIHLIATSLIPQKLASSKNIQRQH